MSKLSVITMKDEFRAQILQPLKVFVTTNHDRYNEQEGEGKGGIVVIAPCENEAVKMVDLELKKRGLLPRSKNYYALRTIPTCCPYSEIICDAPVNGGPDARSPKAVAKPPKKRELADPVLFISFDHHSYIPGVAGAIAIADDFVLAGELIDASLTRRGLMPNKRRSYSLTEFSLNRPMVEMLTEG